jgi:hypothetical protein
MRSRWGMQPRVQQGCVHPGLDTTRISIQRPGPLPGPTWQGPYSDTDIDRKLLIPPLLMEELEFPSPHNVFSSYQKVNQFGRSPVVACQCPCACQCPRAIEANVCPIELETLGRRSAAPCRDLITYPDSRPRDRVASCSNERGCRVPGLKANRFQIY